MKKERIWLCTPSPSLHHIWNLACKDAVHASVEVISLAPSGLRALGKKALQRLKVLLYKELWAHSAGARLA